MGPAEVMVLKSRSQMNIKQIADSVQIYLRVTYNPIHKKIINHNPTLLVASIHKDTLNS